jgi:predicted Fe-Mo cluster-binding NifX family protein
MLSLRAQERREAKKGRTNVNVCIAVDEDRGLESSVCGHFGSAPLFLIVDIQSGRYKAVPNSEGGCHSVRAFQGENVGALVVGGIGKGALAAVQAAGIPVLFTEQATVREVVQAFLEGDVPEPTLRATCGGHAKAGEAGQAHGGCGGEEGECCGGKGHGDGGGCACEGESKEGKGGGGGGHGHGHGGCQCQ